MPAVSVRERLVLVLPELERRSGPVHHRPLHVPRAAVLVARVELEPVHDRIVERERVAVRRPQLDEPCPHRGRAVDSRFVEIRIVCQRRLITDGRVGSTELPPERMSKQLTDGLISDGP